MCYGMLATKDNGYSNVTIIAIFSVHFIAGGIVVIYIKRKVECIRLKWKWVSEMFEIILAFNFTVKISA